MSYPQAKKSDHVDVYHGRSVADPYRWLEDPRAPEARTWITAENKLTFGFLEKIPERAAIGKRLTELWNYERYSPVTKHGKRYFVFRNDGLQNQSVLYKLDALDAKPEILLDPNLLSKDGTVAVSGTEISDDGTLLAYSLSKAGSDWQEWHVRDIATGKDLPDHIRRSKFSGASFSHDNKGFFYSRYPEPKAELEDTNFFHQLYYHELGTDQAKDVLVLDDKDHKDRGFAGGVSEDGKYLVITVWQGTDRRTRLYYKEMKPGAPVIKLLDGFDAAYGFVGNEGSTFYVQTDLDAQRGKLIAVDLKKPERAAWKTIIPESATNKLEGVSHLGGGFVAQWLSDAHSVVTFHDLAGKKVRDVALPGIGSASGFGGKSTDTETFYVYASFNTPPSVYRLDLKTGASTLYKKPAVKFDPAAFETRQVVYASKDGTKIPMFLVHKKGFVPTGDTPTFLYGFGGFNVSLTPEFSPQILAWVERGYVYAQPSLRGGGEFGEAWHQAGMFEKKQNVFDDFAAAARYLVDQKITRKERLGIGGGSNGGLLVGASITQHPELFGAAVAQVGVMDMLRYHKFTIGHAWTSEYGSSDEAKYFPVLLAYSPLHNIKAAAYPPTLVMTADHDDRVVPAHSFKFTATLQAAQTGPNPVLIRIETDAGHGAGKPTMKRIEEAADEWSFLLHILAGATAASGSK